MRLILQGHDYKYAVEQILLMLFPEERPEYTEAGGPAGLSATVSLTMGAVYATAVTRIRDTDVGVFTGVSRVRRAALSAPLERDRQCQRIIKMSFYRAAVRLTGAEPAWGALTGIRPAKLFTGLLEQGLPARRAVRFFEREYRVKGNKARLCADVAEASLAVKGALGRRDTALYIGIPFCPTRCAYCSFVSQSVEKSMHLIPPFLDALEREIAATAETARRLGLNIIAVYIGGGTPTTLSAEELARLLAALGAAFPLAAVREFTVEAGRPDTITAEKLAVMGRFGTTRVSVNPQTMSDAVLAAIGRRHTAEDVVAAVRDVRAAGPFALNTDLIAGLPGDSVPGFRETLDRVLALAPENVTVHTLALKKAARVTMAGRGIPDGDAVREMLDSAGQRLRAAGYRPYYLYRQKFTAGGHENVGWSLPGFESLYNILIMEELCTILSLGGGASTKLVSPQTGRIERIFNPKYPHEYIESGIKIPEKMRRIEEFYATEEQHGL